MPKMQHEVSVNSNRLIQARNHEYIKYYKQSKKFDDTECLKVFSVKIGFVSFLQMDTPYIVSCSHSHQKHEIVQLAIAIGNRTCPHRFLIQIKPIRNSTSTFQSVFTNLKTRYFIIFPQLQKYQIAIMFLLNPTDGYSVLQYNSSRQKYGILL